MALTLTSWEIPEDFRGWAVLEWENPACPPLPRRGLKRVVPIDASGHACTSDRPQDVPSGEEVVLVGPDGRRTGLPYQDFGYDGLQAYYGGTGGSNDYPRPWGHYFIGTAQERIGINPALVRPVCATPGPIKNECLR